MYFPVASAGPDMSPNATILLNPAENDPLIPATTGLLLTTNSALVPPPSESDSTLEVNPHAHLRYFDRPEVLEAYRNQLHIQTPDFVLLSESAGVGGRFRPRGPEDVRLPIVL
jgi:hypothetical protein